MTCCSPISTQPKPTTRVAELRHAAMGRDDAPAEVQWARALIAVAVAFMLASGQLCPLSTISGQLMNFVVGVP